MASISPAGTPVNIQLAQSPDVGSPEVKFELQGVYNALHILSQYLNTLREDLEGDPGQDPATSLRFRTVFWGTALQDIQPGDACSSYGTGIVKGVLTGPSKTPVEDPAVTVGSTFTRKEFGIECNQVLIALTEAAVGEPVQVGTGPGVIALSGAKNGQIVWAAGAQSIYTFRQANTLPQYLNSRPLTAEGALFLSNPIGSYMFPDGLGYRWEGYWMPGFPFESGGFFHYNRNFLFPVGICIQDGFVFIGDYVRQDSPIHSTLV